MAKATAKLFQSLEASRRPSQPPSIKVLKTYHLLSKGGKLPFDSIKLGLIGKVIYLWI